VVAQPISMVAQNNVVRKCRLVTVSPRFAAKSPSLSDTLPNIFQSSVDGLNKFPRKLSIARRFYSIFLDLLLENTPSPNYYGHFLQIATLLQQKFLLFVLPERAALVQIFSKKTPFRPAAT
jgi:hypothetical protein